MKKTYLSPATETTNLLFFPMMSGGHVSPGNGDGLNEEDPGVIDGWGAPGRKVF